MQGLALKIYTNRDSEKNILMKSLKEDFIFIQSP